MNSTTLNELTRAITACRICRDMPEGTPLPHEPRPVCVVSPTARIVICGQAPGTRVHASGRPFTDPSGDRLRAWLAVDEATFYDASRIAIVPMGFCFPGLDAKGGDLPPRKECARAWHGDLFAAMAQVELVIAIGQYAQAFHLGKARRKTLTETVAAWRDYESVPGRPWRVIPTPHPSWRNTGWLKRNPWFESDLLPVLRAAVRNLI
ncbi:MAG: uracil-DNA glycosylase family protein [Roseitalea sp.]|nr:uracil-DNA glycosylase family protein [Roseitalea sp.]MBO6950467.1 uracil-DNA glycosylase family protein [Rhizobiaceae bacterium]MBO6591546.1 uracil-DNA glycosylase family protein [Roseitalea sp.]MBO6599401.1 uracil-DNA glycosylase family protein [Roseitalea sp.]MBO6612110.1 uracil-DNA glycosylase family protein [Roseitalea sp.]